MNKIIKITGLVVLILVVALGGVGVYVNLALPNVSAAPDMEITKDDQALIERGAYLANHVAVCIDCHSTRDWTKFSGPIVHGTEGKGGEVFDEKLGLPGTFYSKNITPYGLSSWNDGEVYRLITTGVTKEGEPIFPIMPYRGYNKMDPEDVMAIIAYLRTLPSIEHENPPSSANFPFNFIMRTIPKDPEPFILTEEMSIIEKGKYLLNIAGCGDCHTPQDKGAPIEGMTLAGGFEFKMPKGGTVRSANITPDKETGIGNWTSATFINRFKSYADTSYVPPTVGDNDFNTVMPWMMYADMKTEDLEAIFAYLQTIVPIENRVEKFTPDAILTHSAL